jgi:hypothetical protein
MKNEVSYTDWVVDREELKQIKRRNDCNDPNQRMYSIFKCKYCNVNIDVATESLGKHKKEAIDYHLSKCKFYTGERPVKRNKVAGNFHKTVIPCANVTTTLVPVSNIQQPNEMETLKMEIANLRESHKTLNESHKALNESHEALTKDQEEMKGMVAQHHIYWGCVATAFGYTPPQDPSFLIDKIRQLQQQQPVLLCTNTMLAESNTMLKQSITEKIQFIDYQQKELDDARAEAKEAKQKAEDAKEETRKAEQVILEVKRKEEEANKKAKAAETKYQNLLSKAQSKPKPGSCLEIFEAAQKQAAKQRWVGPMSSQYGR